MSSLPPVLAVHQPEKNPCIMGVAMNLMMTMMIIRVGFFFSFLFFFSFFSFFFDFIYFTSFYLLSLQNPKPMHYPKFHILMFTDKLFKMKKLQFLGITGQITLFPQPRGRETRPKLCKTNKIFGNWSRWE